MNNVLYNFAVHIGLHVVAGRSTTVGKVASQQKSCFVSINYQIFLPTTEKIELQLPVSHCVPLKPGQQLQLNPFSRSVQVALFLHGWLAQSSISVLRGEGRKLDTVNVIFYRTCKLTETKTKSTSTTAKRLSPLLKKYKNITLSASSL